MDEQQKQQLKQYTELLKQVGELWPFKRVVVPQHKLDLYNKDRKMKFTELAFTVDKNVEVTDEMIDEFLAEMESITASARRLDFGDSHIPPTTGREKTSIHAFVGKRDQS